MRRLLWAVLFILLACGPAWAAVVSWDHVTTYKTGEAMSAEDLALRRYRVFVGNNVKTMKKVAENLEQNSVNIPQLVIGKYVAVSCYLEGVQGSDGPRSGLVRYGVPRQVTGVK